MTPFWQGFNRGLAMPIGWPLGWGCFWTGHFWSRVVNIVPDDWERTGAAFVWLYNLFMGWSIRFDDAFRVRYMGTVGLPDNGGAEHG